MGVYSSLRKSLEDAKANFSAQVEGLRKLNNTVGLGYKFEINPEKAYEFFDSEGTKESLRKLFEDFDAADYDHKLGERSGYMLYDPATTSLRFRVKASPVYRRLNGYLKEMERGDCSHAKELAKYLEDNVKAIQIEMGSIVISDEGEPYRISRTLERLSEKTSGADNVYTTVQGREVKFWSQEHLDEIVAWYRDKVLARESRPADVYTDYDNQLLKRGTPKVGNFHYHPITSLDAGPHSPSGPSKWDLNNSRKYSNRLSLVIYKEGDGAGIDCLIGGKSEHKHVKLYEFPVFSIPAWLREIEKGDYTHFKELNIILEDRRLYEAKDGILERGKLNISIDKINTGLGVDNIPKRAEACHEYRTQVLPKIERLCFRQREKIKNLSAERLRTHLETAGKPQT